MWKKWAELFNFVALEFNDPLDSIVEDNFSRSGCVVITSSKEY